VYWGKVKNFFSVSSWASALSASASAARSAKAKRRYMGSSLQVCFLRQVGYFFSFMDEARDEQSAS